MTKKKNPVKYWVAILHCLTDTLVFFSKISCSCSLLILETGRIMSHLPALLGQLGAARECL